MPKPELCFSTPIKFDLETLKELRESASKNQRSLSGEVRFRIIQTLRPKDTDRESGSVKNENNCIETKIVGGL